MPMVLGGSKAHLLVNSNSEHMHGNSRPSDSPPTPASGTNVIVCYVLPTCILQIVSV